MPGRKQARYLAPVVLVAAAVGTYLIVSQHVHTSASRTAHHQVAGGARPHGAYAHATFYTVQAGENMTRIATKTGLSVQTLEQLNPSIDPNSLQTGQRLRLRH
jgi:LysM repeat protein